MRVAFAVSVLTLITPCFCVQSAPRDWEEYKKIYHKIFKPREEPIKNVIYQSNLQEIDDHNYAYRKGETTFKMAVNPLAHLLPTDVKARMNGFKMNLKKRKINFVGFDQVIQANVPLPESVDWRNVSYEGYSVVAPVLDQKMCASCYAVTAVGAIESHTSIKTKKRRINLSIQNVVDCSNAMGNFGCSGGLPDFAYEYAKTNPGINSETNYPYTGEEGKCKHNRTDYVGRIKDWVLLPKGNEEALKLIIATQGPVSSAIDASLPTFHLYSQGVYKDERCKPFAPDHSVLVVGYGTQQNGTDYWLIKNSWGTSWGEQGYMKIIRNYNNHCGIATHATYPVIC